MTQIFVSRGQYGGYNTILKTGSIYEVDGDISMNGNAIDTDGGNIRFGGGDISELDDIGFNLSGQALNTDSAGLHFTLPSGDVLDLTINSVLEYEFNSTSLDLKSNKIITAGSIEFDSTSSGSSSTPNVSSITGNLYLNVATSKNFFLRIAGTTELELDANLLDMKDKYFEGDEITAPGNGATNTFRLYADDNGSGKTRLMVIFNTGAAQQLAIQP